MILRDTHTANPQGMRSPILAHTNQFETFPRDAVEIKRRYAQFPVPK